MNHGQRSLAEIDIDSVRALSGVANNVVCSLNDLFLAEDVTIFTL